MPGSVHGAASMMQLFYPPSSWLDGADVWLDVDCLGAASDYRSKARAHLPRTQPRASKKNPHAE